MTTPGYATLTDTVTSITVDFLMEASWKPNIKRIGSLFYPLGYPWAVASIDGTKGIGGSLTIVSTSEDMEAIVVELLNSNNLLYLELPNGEDYYIIWDPAVDPQGDQPFSLMDNDEVPPLNVWSASYVQQPSP